ncbi:MAG: hypothetical protein ACRDPK_01405 [Carbonactinosporaceae bacterium]
MAGQPRLDLSLTQVAASTLATVAGVVIASNFGGAGTAAGAAVMGLVTTAGTVVVQHFLSRLRVRLRPDADPGGTVPGVLDAFREERWRRRATGAVLATGIAALAVIAVSSPDAPFGDLLDDRGGHGETALGRHEPRPPEDAVAAGYTNTAAGSDAGLGTGERPRTTPAATATPTVSPTPTPAPENSSVTAGSAEPARSPEGSAEPATPSRSPDPSATPSPDEGLPLGPAEQHSGQTPS